MAWVLGGKHFGQFTYEHWFDDEYSELKEQEEVKNNNSEKNEANPRSDDNTVLHKPPQPQ